MNLKFTLCSGLLGLLMLVFIPVANGQNLIGNAGFEANTGLPTGPGQYARASGWGNVNGYPTFSWPYASPDYFHTSGSGLARLPNAFPGTSMPHGGNAVMGSLLWYSTTSNFREYFSRTLSTPLTVGTSYEFSMWVRAAGNPNYGGHGCDCVGATFSVGNLTQNTHEPITVTPTVETNTVFYNNTSWQLLTFSFTATQPATHVTIGNFHNDATTQPVFFSSTGGGASIYFLFDDCAVVERVVLPDGGIVLEGEWKNETAKLSWESRGDLPNGHYTLQRSLDGKFYQGISEEIPHPAAVNPAFFDSYNIPGPRYYRVFFQDENGEVSYSNTVEMKVGSEESIVVNNLFPNPSSERAYLEVYLSENTFASITLRDMMGREVKQMELGDMNSGLHTIPVEVSDLAAGTYNLTLRQGNSFVTRKLMVQ